MMNTRNLLCPGETEKSALLGTPCRSLKSYNETAREKAVPHLAHACLQMPVPPGICSTLPALALPSGSRLLSSEATALAEHSASRDTHRVCLGLGRLSGNALGQPRAELLASYQPPLTKGPVREAQRDPQLLFWKRCPLSPTSCPIAQKARPLPSSFSPHATR
ncbi:uncharacterized protein LOC116525607 [Sapajus apella]|uniref:Uncharacterized protein LOC116525607 n=1 Tax=Sapajus apella TaxID=9515 RepID=A0A6J3ETE7_SAPAP|nr:uncharacterized protein LOC116525607 [Sapajus apella]